MTKRRPGHDRRPAPPPPSSRPRLAGRVLVAVVAVVVVTLAVLLRSFPGSGGSSPSSSSLPSAAGVSTPPSPLASEADTGASLAAPSPGGTGAPAISGIACDVDEQVTYHVHAHLNIRFGGALQPVPADIGVLPTCLYWLHTHAPHGVIHVEAPAETAFTLGQFFDVWGQPLSTTQVTGRTVGAGESLFVFVDRKAYEGDPRGIVLGNLVAIELQVGPKPLEPLPYTFPVEFQ